MDLNKNTFYNTRRADTIKHLRQERVDQLEDRVAALSDHKHVATERQDDPTALADMRRRYEDADDRARQYWAHIVMMQSNVNAGAQQQVSVPTERRAADSAGLARCQVRLGRVDRREELGFDSGIRHTVRMCT
jgi:hypothetical protein